MAYLPLLIALFMSNVARADDLAEATRRTAPSYLSRAEALEHARAAIAAERPGVPAELLLGMAYTESRYTPAATSRVRDGRRITGVPRWSSPPPGVGGPYFCGVVQAAAGRSWSRCLALRGVAEGYRAGAVELGRWRTICRRWGRTDVDRCMLDGHGGGVAAAQRGTSYANRVSARARTIRAGVTARARARSGPAKGAGTRPTGPAS